MNVDDADPVCVLIGFGVADEHLADATLTVFHRHHGVQHHCGLTSRFGDFAQDRIEQEGHVVVDDGDHRHRTS